MLRSRALELAVQTLAPLGITCPGCITTLAKDYFGYIYRGQIAPHESQLDDDDIPLCDLTPSGRNN